MVEIKKLPKSEVEVKFSVAWEIWNKHMDAAVKAVAQSIKVEGFRPGKAPRNIVEQRVGRETLLQEAADRAIQKAWADAVHGEKIEAIGHPKADITKLAEGNPLEFTIVTAVMPTLTLKKDWREKISKKNVSEKKKTPEAVKEEEVEKEIQKIANGRAKLVTVSRAAKKGDSVRIDFSVTMDGKEIEGGSAQDHILVLGSGVFIPGFEEQVEGMKENEDKEFVLSFPETYHEKSLAGKEANFSVHLRVVQEKQTETLDDAFAVSLGKFKTLEELKKNVREGMEKEHATKREEERKEALANTLLENLETEIPDILIEEESVSMVREFEGQLSMMGLTMEGYLEHLKKTIADLKTEWRSQAEKRLLLTLGLLHLAKEEGVDASNEEIEEEMNKTLRYYKSKQEAEKKLDMKRLYSYCKEAVLRRKALEYMEEM